MGTFIKKLRKKKRLNKPNWDKKHIRYEKIEGKNKAKMQRRKNNEK